MTKIYYIGYDAAHSSDFVYDLPEGLDCWLLVVTKTPALFYAENELREYPSNSAALFRPKQKIHYQACTEKYINNWIRFDSNELFLTESTLPTGIPFILPDPVYCDMLFHLLAAENYFNNDYKESSIDYLLRILFNKLMEASCHTELSEWYPVLLELRRKINNNPGYHWSVPDMAADLHISTGYLQSLYKRIFGISCMNDVINNRISHAKEYLNHSAISISELSNLCGYNNVEHFCKQFRAKTGCTPSEYRNLYI